MPMAGIVLVLGKSSFETIIREPRPRGSLIYLSLCSPTEKSSSFFPLQSYIDTTLRMAPCILRILDCTTTTTMPVHHQHRHLAAPTSISTLAHPLHPFLHSLSSRFTSSTDRFMHQF